MAKHFVALLLLLSPAVLTPDISLKSFFIVWNVGQGQWATLVTPKICHHFDMGGERNPLRKVQKICRQKQNKIYLSHWDWDHVSFALKAQKILSSPCLQVPPLGKSSPYKMKILKVFRPCESDLSMDGTVQELTAFTSQDLNKKTNDLSRVLVAKEKILIPGDSPKPQEKIWSQQIPTNKLRILILGHHGSKTSSSEDLLSHLRELKIAIASARFARYGHPHQEVVHRLRKHRVPLLRTEDWGNVWFDSP
ncbi:ComEC/Rec2 family competence protein [Bdellovibrio sp. HCB337]|uniref:ComEC/Rec2 family competence protein n=1 Tax=Bdellovibrio sp. HCB337 TaxID=3394358 RepID=UPI0039A628F7